MLDCESYARYLFSIQRHVALVDSFDRFAKDSFGMTSLGHSLVGASVGILCMPAMASLHRRLIVLMAIIAVANLPDWPIPGWGHFHLAASHSIIVNGAAMVCLALGLHLKGALTLKSNRRVFIGLIVAWLSHFLLDTFYADSRLAIFWPVSDATVSLPLPWLKTLPHVPPPFDGRVVRILVFEALTFLPLLVLAAAIFRRVTSGRMPNNLMR